MLVLSRKRDEEIVIGNSAVIDENFVITVVEIRGDKVRLGIQAVKDVKVHRREVWDAIQRENALRASATKMEMEMSATAAHPPS